MGIPREIAQSSIRFSLGKGTTEADIEATLQRWAKIIERLRRVLRD